MSKRSSVHPGPLLAALSTLALAGCAPLVPDSMLMPADATATSSANTVIASDAADRMARRKVSTVMYLTVFYLSGSVQATFDATPNGGGTWRVSAQFDPTLWYYEYCPDGCVDPCSWVMGGNAHGDVAAVPNVATVLYASGCHEHGSGSCSGNTPVTLVCGFTVNDSGVVIDAGLSIE